MDKGFYALSIYAPKPRESEKLKSEAVFTANLWGSYWGKFIRRRWGEIWEWPAPKNRSNLHVRIQTRRQVRLWSALPIIYANWRPLTASFFVSALLGPFTPFSTPFSLPFWTAPLLEKRPIPFYELATISPPAGEGRSASPGRVGGHRQRSGKHSHGGQLSGPA
jgi:hypothetical protein